MGNKQSRITKILIHIFYLAKKVKKQLYNRKIGLFPEDYMNIPTLTYFRAVKASRSVMVKTDKIFGQNKKMTFLSQQESQTSRQKSYEWVPRTLSKNLRGPKSIQNLS